MSILTLLRTTVLATVATTCLMATAHADDALKMQLTAKKVTTTTDGSLAYQPVTTAPSGTVIQYKAKYSNTIDQDIEDLEVVLPIPANMTFTGDASPSSAQASVDGKTYADMPLMRRIDGKMVKVPLSEYRALRWHVKLLPAKKTASVALNATVN